MPEDNVSQNMNETPKKGEFVNQAGNFNVRDFLCIDQIVGRANRLY